MYICFSILFSVPLPPHGRCTIIRLLYQKSLFAKRYTVATIEHGSIPHDVYSLHQKRNVFFSPTFNSTIGTDMKGIWMFSQHAFLCPLSLSLCGNVFPISCPTAQREALHHCICWCSSPICAHCFWSSPPYSHLWKRLTQSREGSNIPQHWSQKQSRAPIFSLVLDFYLRRRETDEIMNNLQLALGEVREAWIGPLFCICSSHNSTGSTERVPTV